MVVTLRQRLSYTLTAVKINVFEVGKYKNLSLKDLTNADILIEHEGKFLGIQEALLALSRNDQMSLDWIV